MPVGRHVFELGRAGRELTPRKTGRPKHRLRRYRRRRDAKLTKGQVQAAWKLYDQGGMSVRAIARAGWHRWGYASARSAAGALDDAFRLEGYPVRDRLAAVRLACTTHGLAPRGTRTRAYNELRSRRRAAKSRPCKGVRLGYPRKGMPCRLRATAGSDYCFAHDPARRGEVLAILERARAAA